MIYVFNTGIISVKGNNLTWKIYNFFTLPLSVDCEIRSEQFSYRDSRYCLYIWPRGKKGTEDWFGICLYKYDAPGIGDSVQFSIPTTLGNIKSCTVECSENNHFMQEKFMEWSDFLTLSHQIVPDGCLTVACKLHMENSHRCHKENSSKSKDCMYSSMSDPHMKNKYTDYHSYAPLSKRSSFRISSSGATKSSLEASAFNFFSPTTANFFCTSSELQNSSDYFPESIETVNSQFNLPYDTSGTANCDALRGNYLLDSSTTFKKSKLKASENTTTTVAGKVTKKSGCNSTKPQKEEDINRHEVLESKSEAGGAFNSCSSLSHSEETVKTADHCSKGLKALSLNMKSLYLEGKHFDLTIIMKGKEFKVLKGILTSRSPYFSKLFSEIENKNTNNIIVIDPFDACDSTVFHDFLIYVYSGKIEELSGKNIYGLYCAARKFQVQELKEECVQFLKSSQNFESITNIFRSSNDPELLDAAVVLLAKNMEAALNTDEWKRFMQEESNKAVEYHLKALKIGYKKTIL